MTVAATKAAEAMTISETDLTVADILGFPASGEYTVRQESEWMRVTAGAGTLTWTVTRGYAGTTAATHADGTAVYHVPDTYASLSRIKRRLRGSSTIETTDDDDILADYIEAVQSHLIWRLGMFLGPMSGVTTVTLDGTGYGEKVHVPFGFQSLTSLEVGAYSGATFETVNAADYYYGPRTGEPRTDPNQPYTWLAFKDVVTGSWSYFPRGIANVRLTAPADQFGWPASPAKLGEIADTLVIRMLQAKMTGQRDYVGNDEEGNPIISRLLSAEDNRYLNSFAVEISSLAYI